MTAIDAEQSMGGAYAWFTDPTYVPSLAEVQAAEATPEGRAAAEDYYNLDLRTGQYEIWTQEYIAGLGSYVARTLTGYGQPGATVLEVGAGHGRLSGLLRQDLGARGLGASVVATDIKPPRETYFPVERIGHEEALEKYQPTLVIASWMLVRHDWTRAMRKTPSVRDYILIGMPDITSTPSAWRGYASPELGEFAVIDLHYLDALKTEPQRFHDEGQDLTRGFRRYTSAQPPAAAADAATAPVPIK